MPGHDGSEASCSTSHDDETEEDIYLGLVGETAHYRKSNHAPVAAFGFGRCSSCGELVHSQTLVPCSRANLCEGCSDDSDDSDYDDDSEDQSYYSEDGDDDEREEESVAKRGNHCSPVGVRGCECPICTQIKTPLVLRIVLHP